MPRRAPPSGEQLAGAPNNGLVFIAPEGVSPGLEDYRDFPADHDGYAEEAHVPAAVPMPRTAPPPRKRPAPTRRPAPGPGSRPPPLQRGQPGQQGATKRVHSRRLVGHQSTSAMRRQPELASDWEEAMERLQQNRGAIRSIIIELDGAVRQVIYRKNPPHG